MKAEDRKVLILKAAMEEYGRSGMHATSVEVIAERAGVSQPYIFRLFGTKNDLIAAAIEHHTAHLKQVFREAVADRPDGVTSMQAMGLAYLALLGDDVNTLRCQLHTWAAASDPAIKDVAQRTYREIWDEIATLGEATPNEVRDFMSYGMLLTILSALDLMELYGDPDATLKEF